MYNDYLAVGYPAPNFDEQTNQFIKDAFANWYQATQKRGDTCTWDETQQYIFIRDSISRLHYDPTRVMKNLWDKGLSFLQFGHLVSWDVARLTLKVNPNKYDYKILTPAYCSNHEFQEELRLSHEKELSLAWLNSSPQVHGENLETFLIMLKHIKDAESKVLPAWQDVIQQGNIKAFLQFQDDVHQMWLEVLETTESFLFDKGFHNNIMVDLPT